MNILRLSLLLLALFLNYHYNTTNFLNGDDYDIHSNYKLTFNTQKTKIKRSKSRIGYYANSCATFQLVLSGDIELNPGPGSNARTNSKKITRSKQKPSPCTVCWKGVGTNRKRLICPSCLSLTHVSCSYLPLEQQKKIRAANPVHLVCNSCSLNELPFHRCESIDSDKEEIEHNV